MKLRWKLLILLLSISLVPMVLLRLSTRTTMLNMAYDLGENSRKRLTHSASLELMRLVEDHARILFREGQVLTLGLQSLAAQEERRLAETPDVSAWHPDSISSDGMNASHYCKITKDQACLPLAVDFEASLFRATTPRDKDLFESMLPVFMNMKKQLGDLALWFEIGLEDGSVATYPKFKEEDFSQRHRMRRMMNGMMGKGGMMMAFEPTWDHSRFKDYEEKNYAWSLPHIDRRTHKVVVTLSAPVENVDGSIAGEVSVIVPVDSLLHENIHIRKKSERAASFLVRALKPTSGPLVAAVIAQEDQAGDLHSRWRAVTDERQLLSTDNTEFELFLQDVLMGRSNVRGLPFEDEDCLWAYGPVGEHGTALLLVVPKKDVVAQAEASENFVLARVDEELQKTGLFLLAAVALVTLLSFYLSHSQTKNLRIIALAANRLAKGDFSVRTRVNSSDELGDLSRTFDKMVPALKERMEIKRALGLAQEVQQSLLPSSVPRIEGLDVAGTVIYCDETGGDFYDYLEIPGNGSRRLGVAVGDVSDHGIPAALLMGSARAFLRARRMQPGSTAEVTADVNRLIVEDTFETGQFVTLFYLEADGAKGKMKWVRAGHDPAFLYSPSRDAIEELNGTGPALGLTDLADYSEKSAADIEKGSVVLIGTDGIWEARNPEGAMFGKDRLHAGLLRYADLPAQGILDAVLAELAEFRQDAPQDDDITLVVVKFV